MHEVTNWTFGEVRTLEAEDGKVLFCGKDVAAALGYERTADAIRKHCKGVAEMETPTEGGIQKMKSQVTQSVARAARHLGVPEEVAKHLTLSAAEIAFDPRAVKLKHSDLLVKEDTHDTKGI